MRTVQCDILIIGGGPAGTCAAIRSAREGCRVVLVERKSRIGVPVRCAEYIPAPLVGEINLGREYVVQSVKGMKTHLPDGECKETRAPGFTIHRGLFDQSLADAAKKAGAKILLSASALRQDKDKVVVLQNQQKFYIQPKVIIGADGPHSKTGQWIKAPNRHLMAGAQVSTPLIRESDHTHVYFESWIYGGYGWVFPRNETANVGVGINPNHPKDWSVKKVLDLFVLKLIRENIIATPKPQAYTAGWIPAEPVKKIHEKNILLAGDAAGHTHPITGAGIFSAVTCGKSAGKWAARAVIKKDLTLLESYDKEINDFFGPHLTRAFDRRCLMEKDWDNFDAVIKHCWVAFREYYGE